MAVEATALSSVQPFLRKTLPCRVGLDVIEGSDTMQALIVNLRNGDDSKVLRMIGGVAERAHVRGLRKWVLLHMTLIVCTLRNYNAAHCSLLFACMALCLHSYCPSYLVSDGFRIAPLLLDSITVTACYCVFDGAIAARISGWQAMLETIHFSRLRSEKISAYNSN